MQTDIYSYETERGWSPPLRGDADSDTTLVLAFCASTFAEHDAALLDLRTRFPRSIVLGCSTAGEIHGARVVDGSISMAVVRFEHTRLAYAEARVDGAASSADAGASIAERLLAPDLRAVFVLSDGTQANGSTLVGGLNRVLPEGVVVTGGLAGDGDRFVRTWVLSDGAPRQGVVTAVGFYGDRVQIGHGSRGGWDIFGVDRLVTRSAGNVLYELDGMPALALYKKYLGERAAGLPATGLLFPLALRSNDADGRRLVRTILAVDEVTQSLTFAGDIPTGARVQLMHANFDRLIEGAAQAARATRIGSPADAGVLAIAISCVGRRLALGERTEDEVDATLEALPPGTRQVGFYSYGELSPFASGRCELHNQTMTLTTIGEV